MSSSSPFPILDNRPIDKWKVTELKEELKRRRLTTQGLKADLVRRLDDALRAEQHVSERLNAATTPLAPPANQLPEVTYLPVAPGPMQSTPVSLFGAPSSFGTTPEPPAAIVTTPPPVFSKPEVNNACSLDDFRDVVAGFDGSKEVDVKDGVESGVTATDAVVFQKASNEQIVEKFHVETENKETFSGLDSKAQPIQAVLENSATPNQVSEVIPVSGFEVKSDCISTDCVSNNEKIELKGNEIADNVKLEHSVNKSQEPSTFIGESHPVDVEKPPLEHKISVGGGDDADMTKGNNNNVDAGDSEKLNLDRSSADESMDDEPETKQTESVTSYEVVDKSEKNDLLPEKADIIDLRKGEAPDNKSHIPDNKSHPLVASDKRKLPVNDQEAVGNNEPAKRQRRWNSGSIKLPEAQVINSVAPTTTPRSAGLKRDFSRSESSVSEDGPKERVVPPSPKEPTNSLRIDRFLRPFTLKAVQELLGKTGNVTSFWMDTIKTHCYVSYGSVEEAAATREAVYNLQWPPNGGRLLTAEFVGPEEVKAKLEAPPPKPQPQTQAPSQPPPTALPPPPPLAKAPPVKERLPPPPPLVPEEQEPPIVTLDDLFKKTKAIPRIYYLPLSEDQVAAKLAADNK